MTTVQTFSTDRQRFRDTLAGLAEKTKAKLPSLNGRIEKACTLVLAGDVELHDDGTALVNSLSDPTKAYQLAQGVCQCRDWQQAPEHLCAHRLSVGFSRKIADILAAASPAQVPAVPMPPLPEAPVSITLKAQLHGHEVLVTLRGTDFASVQAQVEQASAWLQAQTPAQTTDPTPQCPNGHGGMKRSTKGKGYYCTTKRADGTWCPGK